MTYTYNILLFNSWYFLDFLDFRLFFFFSRSCSSLIIIRSFCFFNFLWDGLLGRFFFVFSLECCKLWWVVFVQVLILRLFWMLFLHFIDLVLQFLLKLLNYSIKLLNFVVLVWNLLFQLLAVAWIWFSSHQLQKSKTTCMQPLVND